MAHTKHDPSPNSSTKALHSSYKHLCHNNTSRHDHGYENRKQQTAPLYPLNHPPTWFRLIASYIVIKGHVTQGETLDLTKRSHCLIGSDTMPGRKISPINTFGIEKRDVEDSKPWLWKVLWSFEDALDLVEGENRIVVHSIELVVQPIHDHGLFKYCSWGW